MTIHEIKHPKIIQELIEKQQVGIETRLQMIDKLSIAEILTESEMATKKNDYFFQFFLRPPYISIAAFSDPQNYLRQLLIHQKFLLQQLSRELSKQNHSILVLTGWQYTPSPQTTRPITNVLPPVSGIHVLVKREDGTDWNGELKHTKPYKGEGIWVYPGGNVFEGCWNETLFSGTLKNNRNGTDFKGDLKNDFPYRGEGIWLSPEKILYQGKWEEEEVFEEHPREILFSGTLIHRNGTDYKGVLRNNLPYQGEGSWMSPDKILYQGTWEKGQFTPAETGGKRKSVKRSRSTNSSL